MTERTPDELRAEQERSQALVTQSLRKLMALPEDVRVALLDALEREESGPDSSRISDSIRHHKKRAFLAHLANNGNIRACTKAVGIHRSTYHEWMKSDPDFKREAQLAKEEYGDFLEAKLSEHVKSGNLTALIVNLKMSGRFVDRVRSEVTGADGGAVQIDEAAGSRALLLGLVRRRLESNAPGPSPLPQGPATIRALPETTEGAPPS